MLGPDVRHDPGEVKATYAEAAFAVDKGLEHLRRSQHADGSWHGDYGGPLFLLPLYVATCHVAGLNLDAASQREMLRYLTAHQNEDGGFGLHVEAQSAVFPTALNYVAARLLGEEVDAGWLSRAREWLERHGGPTQSAKATVVLSQSRERRHPISE